MDSYERLRIPIEVDEMFERVDEATVLILNAILKATKENWLVDEPPTRTRDSPS